MQVSSYLPFLVLFGIASFLILWIAKAKGFFVLPYEKRATPPFTLKALLSVFAIYLGLSIFLPWILSRLVHTFYAIANPGTPPPLVLIGSIQLIVVILILLFFYLFARANNPALFQKIWKNPSVPNPSSIKQDIAIGVLTWFIAFPVVALVGEIADLFLNFTFGLENYEQVAVRYLKRSLISPQTMIIPLFIILIAAPIIEEFLFRGCLQNFFKKHMSVRTAILLSSVCFAFFHFSSSQGIGNISLVITLFTFALFLGFIYERQSSLYASIALHISFNTFSTIRILFFD